jgi:hypothetical protein
MQPEMIWVYEWEDPHFYTMLVQEWQTTTSWTGYTWQDYKANLLRDRGINVIPPQNTRWRHKWGLPFPTLNFIDVSLCMRLCHCVSVYEILRT